MSIKRQLYGLVGKPLHFLHARLFRAMTLGVRVAVIDSNNRILLVKHTYTPGWYFPGGGVERSETMAQAAMREAREEAGIVADGYSLFGIYSQESAFRGDHIALYVVRNFSRVAWKPDGEIEAAEFFALTDLPPDLTDATRRRIEELFHGAAVSEHW